MSLCSILFELVRMLVLELSLPLVLELKPVIMPVFVLVCPEPTGLWSGQL